jgi:hypothetical protein
VEVRILTAEKLDGELGRRILAGKLALSVALALWPASAFARVVINEIHYHPPSPWTKTLEFVELYNDSGETVSLAGWRFVQGIEFEFPAAATIAPGGYAVVCRSRMAFIEGFSMAERNIYGDFRGVLDDGGEELVLVDAFNALIDAVRYDDRPPWPAAADGAGASLQRICARAPSHLPENWAGGPSDLPTPLARNVRVACPPAPLPQPAVAINEIHYHPIGDLDAQEEFVEIHNPGATRVSLGGYRFSDGISFTFPPIDLEPGGYLAVCRDQDYIRRRFGITNTAGNFSGGLSNKGERLELVDAAGRLVDAVRYGDRNEWPYAADGFGYSLERISAAAPSSDPANWAASRIPEGEFARVEAVGPLGELFTQRLIIGISGPGEFLVDNVVLEPLDQLGTNLIENGDFEAGLGAWQPRGNCSDSVVEDGAGTGGSRGLRVISKGFCEDNPCASRDSVSFAFRSPAQLSAAYRLSFDCTPVRGSSAFYCRMLGGVEAFLGAATPTPGRRNSNASDRLAPFISHRGRFPEEPTSRDPVWITARVRTPGTQAPEPDLRLSLRYSVDGVERELRMEDDGLHRDGFTGDGVYGVELPSFPHDTQVIYRIFAESSSGRSASPLAIRPGFFGPEEAWGFYVNDNQPESVLPVYHVLYPGADPANPTSLNQLLNCTVLKKGSFAFRGELYPLVDYRFRGNTACFIKKRNLKLRFNRGHYFRDLRKVNLQGLWTDKSLLREHVAWEFVRELGAPASETEYIRVHLNGEYHGLFLYLEHPDHRYLARNGLDDDGCIYKAKQPPRLGPADPTPIGVAEKPSLAEYANYWEVETCKGNDLSELGGFIDALHADARRAGGPTREFMEERVNPEILIPYQITQVALNNIDSFAKNHFLFQDAVDLRWSLLCWDLDLVFGKFFNPQVVDRDAGREVGTLNDCMLSPEFDLNPWFAAAVGGNPLLNHFVDLFLRAGRGYYQRAYLVRLYNVLQEKYTNEVYDSRLDELELFLDKEQRDDLARWGRYPSNPGCVVPSDMRFHVRQMKQQLALHRDFLLRYLRDWHPSVIDPPRLQFTEIMYRPGASEDLEFIELLNTSGRRIEIADWRIAGGVEFTFPPGSSVEAGEVILVVKSLARFRGRYPEVAASRQVFGNYAGRLSNDGEKLWLLDAGPGYPATVDYLEYGDRQPWPDTLDAHSIELKQPGPGRDNDRPEHWRQSLLPGGTPGSIAPVFLRGDADGDRRVTISDAVRVLLFLFQSGTAPACAKAADADDDGAILITDGIFVLNFLFKGGPQPPPPYPEIGFDPTPDSLGCY